MSDTGNSAATRAVNNNTSENQMQSLNAAQFYTARHEPLSGDTTATTTTHNHQIFSVSLNMKGIVHHCEC